MTTLNEHRTHLRTLTLKCVKTGNHERGQNHLNNFRLLLITSDTLSPSKRFLMSPILNAVTTETNEVNHYRLQQLVCNRNNGDSQLNLSITSLRPFPRESDTFDEKLLS